MVPPPLHPAAVQPPSQPQCQPDKPTRKFNPSAHGCTEQRPGHSTVLSPPHHHGTAHTQFGSYSLYQQNFTDRTEHTRHHPLLSLQHACKKGSSLTITAHTGARHGPFTLSEPHFAQVSSIPDCTRLGTHSQVSQFTLQPVLWLRSYSCTREKVLDAAAPHTRAIAPTSGATLMSP